LGSLDLVEGDQVCRLQSTFGKLAVLIERGLLQCLHGRIIGHLR
jgi:hypothetical protein